MPISGFHDVIADEIDQFADLDTRLLEIVNERLSEGTVVSSAIHRDLAGASGVNHHGTRLGRGFGVFSTRKRRAYGGRNPATGAVVVVKQKSAPFFRAGKEMHQRLNPPEA